MKNQLYNKTIPAFLKKYGKKWNAKVYDDEFERQMIKSNLNEITDPFLSQFGWHILEVLGTRVEDKTNENVEDRAFSYLFNRKFQEELETDLQELRADAFVEIKELD